MSDIQPGVRIQQQTIYQSESERATAVPVFIGYTDKGADEQLHKIYALANYKEKFLDAGRSSPVKCAYSYLYAALKHYFEAGGEPCFVLPLAQPNLADKSNKQAVSAALKQAAQSKALTKEPTITLMAMPDLALLDPALDPGPAPKREITPAQWIKVWQAMLDTCKKNDWFAVLDTPSQADAARTLINQSGNELDNGAQYGAAYWPRLRISASEYDHLPARIPPSVAVKQDDISACIPPSAAVIAMMQRVDRERGIWKAPANVPLLHVIAPEHEHWEAQDLFNAQACAINVIRSFAGRGVRVWGCRTLARGQAAQRHYVQTQRLLAYIKIHLKEKARFVTFEPNNEITWIKLQGLTRAWLRQLWLQGGLFGATEEEAFRVFLGLNETMTRTDIQMGKLIMRVCVAPNYPAEFIDISLQFYTSESHLTQSALPQDRKMSA